MAGLLATYVVDPTCFQSPSPTIKVLLHRPSHKIPAAKWHARGASTPPSNGPLTTKQVLQYYNDGFLVLPNFFQQHLPGLQSDVESLINTLASDLFDAGHVKSTYSNSSWTERLLRLTEDYPDAPLVLIKGGVLPAHFQRLYSDVKMLDVANQLGVGPDVAVNAAWNLRAKMQRHEETTVPWHQDNSYWEPRIWDEHVITVWVSLVDANVENGCMQFVKGGHMSGKTARHTIGTTTRTWYTELAVDDMKSDLFTSTLEDNDDVVESRMFTAEVPAGTAIIFPGTTPHRSLNSVSDQIRWSTDYRLHRHHATRKGKSDSSLDWFYGLKDSLLLREGNQGEKNGEKGSRSSSRYSPNWSEWAKMERTKIQDEGLGAASSIKFDPVIVGPWMDLWNITTHQSGGKNEHVERYMETEAGRRPGGEGYLPDNW